MLDMHPTDHNELIPRMQLINSVQNSPDIKNSPSASKGGNKKGAQQRQKQLQVRDQPPQAPVPESMVEPEYGTTKAILGFLEVFCTACFSRPNTNLPKDGRNDVRARSLVPICPTEPQPLSLRIPPGPQCSSRSSIAATAIRSCPPATSKPPSRAQPTDPGSIHLPRQSTSSRSSNVKSKLEFRFRLPPHPQQHVSSPPKPNAAAKPPSHRHSAADAPESRPRSNERGHGGHPKSAGNQYLWRRQPGHERERESQRHE